MIFRVIGRIKRAVQSVATEIKSQFTKRYPDAKGGWVALFGFLVVSIFGVAGTKLVDAAIDYVAKRPAEAKPTVPKKELPREDATLVSIPDKAWPTDGLVRIPGDTNSDLEISSITLANTSDKLLEPEKLANGWDNSEPFLIDNFLSQVQYDDCIHPPESYSLEAVARIMLTNSFVESPDRAKAIVDRMSRLGTTPASYDYASSPTSAQLARLFLSDVDEYRLGRSPAMYQRLKKMIETVQISEGEEQKAELPIFDIVLHNKGNAAKIVTGVRFEIFAIQSTPEIGQGDASSYPLAFSLPALKTVTIKASTLATLAKLKEPIIVPPMAYARWKVTVQVDSLSEWDVAGWLGHLRFMNGKDEVTRTPAMCSVVLPIGI